MLLKRNKSQLTLKNEKNNKNSDLVSQREAIIQSKLWKLPAYGTGLHGRQQTQRVADLSELQPLFGRELRNFEGNHSQDVDSDVRSRENTQDNGKQGSTASLEKPRSRLVEDPLIIYNNCSHFRILPSL